MAANRLFLSEIEFQDDSQSDGSEQDVLIKVASALPKGTEETVVLHT